MVEQNLKAAMDLIRGQADSVAARIKADPGISEIRKLLQSLNALEELSGVPPTTLATVLQFGGDDGPGSSTTMATRPDEFYGLEPLEAAKRVLKKLGRSATIDEIMERIKAGGGDTGSQDSLQLSLARSTVEIAKIKDGVFGLLEFYPHIKRGKPGRKKRGDSDTTNGTEGGPPPDTGSEDLALSEEVEKDQ
ncbi:MAG TPA: hypothetical protein VE959_34270 [Bryobacteraceae bacterium]|nr:hypothetical protein [Bryobacteraceae bacterium]